MLQEIKRSFTKKDLHKIAKTIQWYCRYNLSAVYRKAFNYINRITYDDQIKYELKLNIEDSLNPSNKLYNSDKVKSLLKSIGIHEDREEYKLIEFLTTFKLPSLKTIIADLGALLNEFKGIHFKDDHLTVEIGPFTLNGVDFGNFQVAFNIKYLCLTNIEYAPHIYAVTPNYPDGDDSHPHPHIRGSDICLGRGRQALYSAITGARLQDYFQIISSILNTYNEDDPFAHIEKWNGDKCGNCEIYYDPANGSFCDKCEKSYCVTCVRKCCSVSDMVCFKCKPALFNCGCCGKAMCSECIKICDKCACRLCSDHVAIDSHRCV